MNSFEPHNSDVIDLGAVQDETHGASILGDEDLETNQRFLVFGLASED